jgi:hypothetical protein
VGNRGGIYRRPAARDCEILYARGGEISFLGGEVGLERWIRVERTAGIRLQERHADRGAPSVAWWFPRPDWLERLQIARTVHTKSAVATEDGRSHVTRFFAVCR